MKIKNIVTVSLIAAILGSCAPLAQVVPTESSVALSTFTPVPTEHPAEAQFGEEIQINAGDSVTLDNGKLTITFKSLVSDSRCPQEVVCVWGGNAEVILEVSTHKIALNTALDPREEVVGDYNIQLRDVIPYPKVEEEYAPEAYSIKIVVSKTPPR